MTCMRCQSRAVDEPVLSFWCATCLADCRIEIVDFGPTAGGGRRIQARCTACREYLAEGGKWHATDADCRAALDVVAAIRDERLTEYRAHDIVNDIIATNDERTLAVLYRLLNYREKMTLERAAAILKKAGWSG